MQAVLTDGVAVDAVLAITFTEKAAAQLTTRVRKRFAELGARDEARQAESAWISTIHGFCSRVLRTHALSAGVDPEFRVLDAVEAERVALDAFDRALAGFLADGAEEERLRLIAAHTPDRLADMMRTAYSHLRSQGHTEPALPEAVRPPIGAEREALAAALGAAAREIGAAEGENVGIARDKLERCAALLDALPGRDRGAGRLRQALLRRQRQRAEGSARATSSAPRARRGTTSACATARTPTTSCCAT